MPRSYALGRTIFSCPIAWLGQKQCVLKKNDPMPNHKNSSFRKRILVQTATKIAVSLPFPQPSFMSFPWSWAQDCFCFVLFSKTGLKWDSVLCNQSNTNSKTWHNQVLCTEGFSGNKKAKRWMISNYPDFDYLGRSICTWYSSWCLVGPVTLPSVPLTFLPGILCPIKCWKATDTVEEVCLPLQSPNPLSGMK